NYQLYVEEYTGGVWTPIYQDYVYDDFEAIRSHKIGNDIYFAVKIDDNVKKQDLRGLVAFCDEHKPEQAYVVSRDARPRKMTTVAGREILILPWEIFLKKLWNKEII
ncbi:MAG TPA: hypothetical protein PK583_06060, partial [Gammaproteobacteria bacterium]|nr:hypothetical protein [Gammaproteobacteria bacterium]